MPIVETLVVTLGPAVAKSVFKIWLKDSDVAMNVSSSLLGLLTSKTRDGLAQRRAQRQFETIGDKVAQDLTPLFERAGLPENSQEAVVNVISFLNEQDRPLTSLEILEPNLESVFLHLTGKKLRE